MNINTFEQEQQELVNTNEASFVDEEALLLREKIEKRKAKQKRLKIIIGVVSGVITVLVILVCYSQYKLYKLSQEESVSENSSQAITPKTAEEILKALKRHILVPTGNPQIAEIQDVARLKETQAFFKDAKNGDYVIVYEAVIFIYRPQEDIVVASGDISGVGQINP